MAKLIDKISVNGFSIENLDLTYLEDIYSFLPKNGVFDLNIAEKGVVLTLQAQDFCQEQIAKIDRVIGFRENKVNKAWSDAALQKAKEGGHTAVKNREWFAQADEDYIKCVNELTLAKAAKKYLETKASFYSGWHYAFKSFLQRDYKLERLGNFNQSIPLSSDPPNGRELDWGFENSE